MQSERLAKTWGNSAPYKIRESRMAKRKDEASPLETPEHRYELRLVGAPTLSVPSLSEAFPLDPSKAALLAYLAVEGACQPKRLNDVIWTSAASTIR